MCRYETKDSASQTLNWLDKCQCPAVYFIIQANRLWKKQKKQSKRTMKKKQQTNKKSTRLTRFQFLIMLISAALTILILIDE